MNSRWRALESCAIYSVTVTLWLRLTWDFSLSFLCLPLLLFLILAAKLSVKQCGRRVDGPYFFYTEALYRTECFGWWPAILFHLVPETSLSFFPSQAH